MKSNKLPLFLLLRKYIIALTVAFSIFLLFPSVTHAATATTTSTGTATSTKIPGTTEAGGIVSCGRPGQDMCTLCDLIKGMNIIIKYLMRIAVGVVLLMFTIGGVMYIVSAGDSGLIERGKTTMLNSVWGFLIIFAGFLIINTTISYIGTKPGMGINVTSWGNFDCNPGNH